MLLTLPNEIQEHIFALCQPPALHALLSVSVHIHAQAARVLYARPVVIRSWSALVGLFSLPRPSSYASRALAVEWATSRRQQLDLIRTLILDFPDRFVQPETWDVFSEVRGWTEARDDVQPKGESTSLVFGPIPRLLNLRSSPLLLDTLLLSHGQPFHPLAPLLACLNPTHFGDFAFRGTSSRAASVLSEELDWNLYACFGRRVWSRLERWSYAPKGLYFDEADRAYNLVRSSPLKAIKELETATVYLRSWTSYSCDVLYTSQQFFPPVKTGGGVRIVVRGNKSLVQFEQMRQAVIDKPRSAKAKRWWEALTVEIGGRETMVGGRTVWPPGLLSS